MTRQALCALGIVLVLGGCALAVTVGGAPALVLGSIAMLICLLLLVALQSSLAQDKADELLVIARNTERMGIATHILVNSKTGMQLLATVRALEKVARLTQDPEDAHAVLQARQIYDDHQAKQQVVDDQPNPAPTTSGEGGPPTNARKLVE